MTDRPQVWLVRHGETDWSLSGQHTGRTDVPLTPTGQRQAEALGRHLGGRSFALVLTSPIGRALETCRLAGYGGTAQVIDDLREWDYGIYEGSLGSWYSHTRIDCADATPKLSEEVTPGAGNRYYLVVAHNGAEEGSYGIDGASGERPLGTAVCASAQEISPCP